jgi:hypothetical protein
MTFRDRYCSPPGRQTSRRMRRLGQSKRTACPTDTYGARSPVEILFIPRW